MKKKIIYILLGITFLSSIGYLGYVIFGKSIIFTNVMSALILFLFSSIFVLIGFKLVRQKSNLYIPVASLLLLLFILFSLFNNADLFGLAKANAVKDFTNTSISEALKWANANDIEVTQQYEYSDLFETFSIISQNVKEGTDLNKVNKITFIISNGPNYDKTVIVPNMLGWKADDVITFVNDNHLINVNVTYIASGETKDTVINQDKTGEIKRSDVINLILSLGVVDDLQPVELIDFTNKSLFETIFWLKRNVINYNLQYQFSDTIRRNYIINQSIEKGETITPNVDSKLVITVSKGKEIVVPDLMSMMVKDITKWIVDNNLKINFGEQYDETLSMGKIISVNHKNGDIVEEGTLINIVVSKGQLKFPNITSVYKLREWANEHNVQLDEEYEFSNTIASGSIISLSHKANDIILDNDKITVVISQGKPITIPNFSGKTKAQATSLCNLSGLRCSFTYGSYSSTVAKDTVTAQSKKSGVQIIQGSSIVITLSKGNAQSYEFSYQESWLKIGDADGTISTIRSMVISRYPNVTFNFVKKSHNTLSAGLVHPDSPTNIGSKVVQGQTYTVWIVSN